MGALGRPLIKNLSSMHRDTSTSTDVLNTTYIQLIPDNDNK